MNTREEKIKTYAISMGSSVAVMIAKLLTHPIDTIKSKLQVSRA